MRDPIGLSPLGFGCAPVMGRVGRKQALRSMAEAFEFGVTHFDSARSYGFGLAESVLGDFLKGRRDHVTITSKFGVIPPRRSLIRQAAMPLARAARSLFPSIGSSLRRRAGRYLDARNFSVAYAEECLHQSLRELNTDCIDVYLIHEPDLALLKASDEIRQFMEACIDAGKIRRWGVAPGDGIDLSRTRGIDCDVIQFDGSMKISIASAQWDADKRQRIVTRPLSGGVISMSRLAEVLELLDLNAALRDLNASAADVALCIARRVAGHDGSVLCSMFTSSHIQNNVRAIQELNGGSEMTGIVSAVLKFQESANTSWGMEGK